MGDARAELNHTHFKSALAGDVAALLIDDHIGSGQFREVYAHAADPKLVVKLEDYARSFSNIREHDLWASVKDTVFARWFAPVHGISPCGIVLIQSRTQPVKASELPCWVPAFFTDLKAANWGRYKGRIVCHDYGNHLMLENGMTKRMRKANWQ